MKRILSATAVLFYLGITACGGGDNGGTVKVDTTVTPTDNANVQPDTTKPANAPGLDTVGGGKSTSSGIKDTSKK